MSRNFTAGTREDGTARLWRDGEPVNGNFFGQSAFATHALVNERNAVVVDTDLPARLLAPFGCAVQTGAGSVLNVLAPAPTAPVVVIGAGAVGLSAVMTAALENRTVIAVDTRDSRLDLALDVGATHVVNASRGATDEGVRSILGGGASHIVESSGSPAALGDGIRALASGGTIAVVGTARAAPPSRWTSWTWSMAVNASSAWWRERRAPTNSSPVWWPWRNAGTCRSTGW